MQFAYSVTQLEHVLFCFQMLNCILSMVEKTKRALAILQERNLQEMSNADDGIHMNGISNDHSSNAIRRTVAEEVKRTANELMAHTVRLTEERVAFVRKKAGKELISTQSIKYGIIRVNYKIIYIYFFKQKKPLMKSKSKQYWNYKKQLHLPITKL